MELILKVWSGSCFYSIHQVAPQTGIYWNTTSQHCWHTP